MNTQEIEVRHYLLHALPTRRDVAAVVFRHWKSTMVVSGLIILATILTGVWTPNYEARMKILVQSRRTDAVISSSSVLPVEFNGNTVSEEDINSEVELLTGNDLLRRVVLASGLVSPKPSAHGAVDENAVSAAVKKLSRNLDVEAMRRTHLISVRYYSRDPKQARAVLAALASAYVDKHVEVHRASGESAFFDQEAERFRKGLQQAQQKLAAFELQHHVVAADTERNSALQQANEFQAQAREAQAQVSETESRIQALQGELNAAQPRITTAVRSADNPQLMGQLKSTLLTLQLKRTELLTRYDPGYPLVREVDRQIADTTAAIQAEENHPARDETTDRNPGYQLIKDELAKAQSDLSGLKARQQAAQAIAGQYQQTAQQLDSDSMIQQNLIRDAKTQEDFYLLYVQKSQEAGISDALDRRGILNVAIAEEPNVPALPQRSPLISAILTLLLVSTGGFATAFVMDAMDPTFRTPDELAAYLEVPVLAALPKDTV